MIVLLNVFDLIPRTMANPMLLWFVGYSNMTSIVIVTLCFLAMTLFIGFISMSGDCQSRSNNTIGIEQRNMVKMPNPFFLQLEQHSKKLADGLHLRLSSLLPSSIFVLWGAKINTFHDLILKPGKWINKAFVLNKVEDYKELDILHCDHMQFLEAGDHYISLHCPDCVSSETLGDMPRKRYPAAVFTFVLEDDSALADAVGQDEVMQNDDILRSETESENENRNPIIGLISIVHLQDEKVTQSSHFIGQYVKTSGVPLYSLQPLYLNSDSCQSQHTDKNREHMTAQQQSKSRKSSTENPAATFKVSSKPQTHGSSPCDYSVHGTDGSILNKCLSSSSGSSNSENSESGSMVRKRDLLRQYKFQDNMTDACDGCSENSKTLAYGESCIKSLKVQSNGPENEDGMMPKSLSDVTNVDNYTDDQDCHTNSQAECVVCQAHIVRCVLLPCRHACVCLGCFKLLYRCPLCRAGIESYFLLPNNRTAVDGVSDDEDDGQDEEDENDVLQDLQHQAVNASFHQMWQRFNTRLNNFLGFR